MGKAKLYFMDLIFDLDWEEPQITDVNSGLDQLARYTSRLENLLRILWMTIGFIGLPKVKYLSPRCFYRGEHGLLFEYDAVLDNGSVSVKLIFSDHPERVLFDYYQWERSEGGVYG